ncbi:MAG: hypothetical protein JKY65_15720 [Planctomycetes bacterium]|nr:hypothetical protein [Planctomycetota bacterium]
MIRPQLTVCLILAIGLCSAAPASAKDGKLTGFDTLGRKGRKVKVKAKLETIGFMGIDPDVKGAALDFFILAKDGVELKRPDFLGTEKTNDDGVATLVWTAPESGQFSMVARLRKGADHAAAPAQIHVAVPPEDRPILIVQLDGTVTTATNLKFFRGTKNEEIKAVDGCKQALELLATRHQLVYLTDLELAFTNKFKDWVRLRGLPHAPILFWELFERSLSHETYMTKMIEKLQRGYPLRIGVGGDTSDTAAFLKSGMVPIRLGEEPDEELGDEVIQVKDWGQVLGHTLKAQEADVLLRRYSAGKEASEALRDLSQLGAPGVAYLTRLRRDRDLNLASAATLIVGRLRGIAAFSRTLDRSNADRSLNSLIAAWRYGQPAVVAQLYEDGVKPGPLQIFLKAELISRTEPEPGKVAFKLRLHGVKGKKARELELIFVESEEGGVWLVGS